MHSWPAAKVTAVCRPSRIASARRGQRGAGHHGRVDAAHLRVDRDRDGRGARRGRGARARRACEPVKPTAATPSASTSASPSSCAAPCTDANVPAGSPAPCTARATQRATSSLVPGWDGWPLAITGQPGRQRGRGVAAGHAEGEREVAGAEHDHGAERDEHAPHVGPRDRAGVRVGGVDDRLEVVARRDDVGEQLELDAGALELAGHAARRAARSRPRRWRAARRRPRAARRAAPRSASTRSSRVGERGVGGRVDGGGDQPGDVLDGGLGVVGEGGAGAGVDGGQGGGRWGHGALG